MKMKVYKQWLADENNNIIYRPLSFWIDYFEVKPLKYKDYKCFWKSEKTGKTMDIEKRNGYGLLWDELKDYENKLFFVGNADLNTPKLREKY